RPNRGGGRGIEIPYITQKFKNIHGKKIADFGCLEEGNITTNKYKIPNDNKFYYFDIKPKKEINKENYYCRNFTNPDIFEENYFDYGLSVSVIEHIGLDIYDNQIQEDGDIKAVKNILKTIKPGGILYITIPVAECFYMPKDWIYCYSIKQLESWEKIIPGKINIETFQFIKDTWYSCPKEKIIGSYHYTGYYDIVAIACLEIIKD
ncbi:MAG: DUF268 domain-containing protein, partial [Bacillota bacterium]